MTIVDPYGQIFRPYGQPPRRRVFVSYHHRDRRFYEQFAGSVKQFDLLTDRSLEDEIDSRDDDYVYRTISEGNISGTTCTIVLCGTETYLRKHVDWEIKATLDKQHGLIGVPLPQTAGTLLTSLGTGALPARLLDNRQSGYAPLLQWSQVCSNAAAVAAVVDYAVKRPKDLIRNSRPMMFRNGHA